MAAIIYYIGVPRESIRVLGKVGIVAGADNMGFLEPHRERLPVPEGLSSDN